MELNAFAAALLRRWYLVLVTLALTAAATYFVVDQVGPSYAAKGTILLLPPQTTIDDSDQTVTQGNPYLYLGGLNPARDILIRTLTATTTRDAIEEQYPGTGYEMSSDPGSDGPIIAVEVSGSDDQETIAALDTLLSQVESKLVDLQSSLGINSDAFISARTLTADERPEVVRKGQIRSGIVAGAGTLALSLLAIGLVDGLLSGRNRDAGAPGTKGRTPFRLRRRSAEGDEPEEPEPELAASKQSARPKDLGYRPPPASSSKPSGKRPNGHRPGGPRPGSDARGKSPTGR